MVVYILWSDQLEHKSVFPNQWTVGHCAAIQVAWSSGQQAVFYHGSV